MNGGYRYHWYSPVVVIGLMFLLVFFYMHSFVSGIVTYQLNKNAYKKRKKGQNFWEWLSFSRFRDEIPRFYLGLYRIVLLLHPICLIVCEVLLYSQLSDNIREVIVHEIMNGVFGIDVILPCVLHILFNPRKGQHGYRYERWIVRMRGKQRK